MISEESLKNDIEMNSVFYFNLRVDQLNEKRYICPRDEEKPDNLALFCEVSSVLEMPKAVNKKLIEARLDEKRGKLELSRFKSKILDNLISKALLLHELNTAKELGAKKATIYTAMPEKYPAPNKLYESVGFKLVGNIYVWKKSA